MYSRKPTGCAHSHMGTWFTGGTGNMGDEVIDSQDPCGQSRTHGRTAIVRNPVCHSQDPCSSSLQLIAARALVGLAGLLLVKCSPPLAVFCEHVAAPQLQLATSGKRAQADVYSCILGLQQSCRSCLR